MSMDLTKMSEKTRSWFEARQKEMFDADGLNQAVRSPWPFFFEGWHGCRSLGRWPCAGEKSIHFEGWLCCRPLAVLPARRNIHFGGWLCCRPLADAGDGRVGRWLCCRREPGPLA